MEDIASGQEPPAPLPGEERDRSLVSFALPASSDDDESADPAGPASARSGSEPDLLAALDRIEAEVATGVADLLRELRERLALDRFKEEQIARLHEELQGYKADLVRETARQVLRGVIRLHDDLGKTAAALRQKPVEELTPERMLRQLADLLEDIEILLGQHGVEPYEADGDAFDPHRQTALRTIVTDDPESVGRVAARLRPGFAEGDTLLQKQRVAVYVAPHNGNRAQGEQA